MRRILKVAMSPVVLFVCVVMVAGAGIADAATGGAFILGKHNYASGTTTLTSTKGAPLYLQAPKNTPPLAVNSKVKVPFLNSDLLDGLDSTQLQRRVTGTCANGAVSGVTAGGGVACRSFQQPFARTIVVSPGATAIASGAALTSAYATAAASATPSSPRLVLLEPGVYDLNGGTLTLHGSVQLSGMGQDVTTITSTGDIVGTLIGVDGSIVTDLSVVANGSGGNHAIGYVQSAGSGIIRRVTVRAAATSGATIGVAVEAGTTLVADQLTSNASGSAFDDLGVYVNNFPNANLVMTDSTTSASGGGSTVNGLYVHGVAHVANTEIGGGAFSDGTLTCVDDYNASFVALNTSCA